MIRTIQLGKMYDRKSAVVDLNLEVERGELFGFLGPNGAGKTTTIRMLTGLLKPSSGTAIVAGHDVLREPLAVKRSIGYLAQTPYLYDKLTGREFLHFMGDLYRVPAIERRRLIGQLAELFVLEDALDQLIEGYSGGTRLKVALTSALIHNPQVLILDEPTSGLDPRSARTVKDILRGLVARGTTVFMSSHVLEIVEHMCDRVAIIDHGRLIAVGTLSELRSNTHKESSSLEEIFLELTGGPEYEQIAAYLKGE